MFFASSSRSTDGTQDDPERSPLAQDTYDVFRKPFAPEAGRRYVHLHNIANSSPRCMYDDDGRYLDAFILPGPLDERGRLVCEVKDSRMIAPTRGHTTVGRAAPTGFPPSRERAGDIALADLRRRHVLGAAEMAILAEVGESVRDYIAYLLEVGLLDPADLHNLLLTDGYLNYDAVLRVTAEAGRVGYPYFPSPRFARLCDEYGVRLHGRTAPEVAFLADKHAFRDFVVARRPDLDTVPRLWCPRGTTPEPSQLDRLVATSDGDDVLFLQKVHSGGGVGNYKVTRRDGGFTIATAHRDFTDSRGLAAFVGELDADVEVTPFLRVLASPTLGLIIGERGVSCVGPFEQILDDDNDYVGFRLDRGDGLGGLDPDVRAFVRERRDGLVAFALGVGELQRAHGYVGYSSIDALVFRDAAGVPRLALSEENMRFTATCMLQMIVHGRPALRARFLAGELSLMQHDALPLSEETLRRTGASSVRVAGLLRAAGLPMLGRDSDAGVMLTTRPGNHFVGMSVGIGVVAGEDSEREHLFSRVREVLS